nr:VPA1269 family protein [Burkholderia contaminans]
MGASAPDWLDVTEDEIDRDDPDCVWRIRNAESKLSRWSSVADVESSPMGCTACEAYLALTN